MAKSKVPLLVLHGALGSAEQMQPLTKLLSETEIFTLDFTGHGTKSHSDESFTIDLFVQDVKRFLDVKKILQVNIFGYSMGGYVALKLATEDNRVNNIVTLGTKFLWTPESAAHEVKLLDPIKIEEKVPAFAEALAKRHGSKSWKQVMNKTTEMMLALGDQPVLTEAELQKVAILVMIAIGGKDNMVSIEESKWASDNISKSVITVLDDFKHPIEQIDLKKLASLLRKTL